MKAFVSTLRCHLRCKRGADLSLVVVGFSLTVANGLVPLQHTGKDKKKKKGFRGENIRKCSNLNYVFESSAFQNVQASSGDLFTWSETDDHSSRTLITEKASEPLQTLMEAIMPLLDHCPHLQFSDLMASWYTSVIIISSSGSEHEQAPF